MAFRQELKDFVKNNHTKIPSEYIDTLCDFMQPLYEKMDTMSRTIDTIQRENRVIKRETHGTQARLAGLQYMVGELQSTLEDRDMKVDALVNDVQVRDAKMDVLRNDVDVLQNDVNTFKDNLSIRQVYHSLNQNLLGIIANFYEYGDIGSFCRDTHIYNIGQLGHQHMSGWHYIQRRYNIPGPPWDFWKWLKRVKLPFDLFVHGSSLKPEYDVNTIRNLVTDRIFHQDQKSLEDFLWVLDLKTRLGCGAFEE